MDPAPGTVNFDLIDEPSAGRRRRWIAFGISSALQPVGVALAVWLLAALPQGIQPKERNGLYFQVALLLAPKPRISTPIKLSRLPQPQVPRIAPELRPLKDPPPLIARALSAPEPPKLPADYPPLPPARLPIPELSAPPKRQAPAVRTDVFSASSAAKIRQPARKVQTGGFGDVNGLPGIAQGGNAGNVARLGSFDLPIGPGYGNGSGASHGVRGTVMSAGFDKGIASGGGERGQGGGGVRESGFGNLNSPPQVVEKRTKAGVSAQLQPVEILSKPNPTYTEEARRLRVEGEVVLDVIFSASGELRVLRLARGLGHGLDEAALRAAEQIVFKPARRDGQPVDSRAMLRIIFRLAY